MPVRGGFRGPMVMQGKHNHKRDRCMPNYELICGDGRGPVPGSPNTNLTVPLHFSNSALSVQQSYIQSYSSLSPTYLGFFLDTATSYRSSHKVQNCLCNVQRYHLAKGLSPGCTACTQTFSLPVIQRERKSSKFQTIPLIRRRA